MPNNNTCSIFQHGRIKIFTNVSLLAYYLEKDAETLNRWKRQLRKSGKPLLKYCDSILIDFEPEIFNNKKS